MIRVQVLQLHCMQVLQLCCMNERSHTLVVIRNPKYEAMRDFSRPQIEMAMTKNLREAKTITLHTSMVQALMPRTAVT